MTPITRPPVRTWLRQLVAGPLVLYVLLAACSTAGSGAGVATIDRSAAASPSPTSGAEMDFDDAILAYTGCMRRNGIEVSDPVSGHGDGSDSQQLDEPDTEQLPFDPESEEYRKAEDECSGLLEGVVADGREEQLALTEEEQEALLAYTECLRENGIDIGDPNEYGEADVGAGVDGEPQPDAAPPFDEEAFRAADEACRELRSKLPQGDEEHAP